MLDSFLDVTSDLASVPLALGPDPVLLSASDDVETLQQEIDQGYYEITEELREGEELPQLVNRDVEWM